MKFSPFLHPSISVWTKPFGGVEVGRGLHVCWKQLHLKFAGTYTRVLGSDTEIVFVFGVTPPTWRQHSLSRYFWGARADIIDSMLVVATELISAAGGGGGGVSQSLR